MLGPKPELLFLRGALSAGQAIFAGACDGASVLNAAKGAFREQGYREQSPGNAKGSRISPPKVLGLLVVTGAAHDAEHDPNPDDESAAATTAADPTGNALKLCQWRGCDRVAILATSVGACLCRGCARTLQGLLPGVGMVELGDLGRDGNGDWE